MPRTLYGWFFVAGLIGAFGGYEQGAAGYRVYGRSLAWLVIAIMGGLGLLGLLPAV